MAHRNVFVLGLDRHNLDSLARQYRASDYRFHPLLSMAELRRERVDLPDLLSRAQAQLDAFDGRIDAIVGYWDFPVSEISAGIEHIGPAFDFVLGQVELPDEVARTGGQACLAEEAVDGPQLTVEGYSHGGAVHLYGAVDSIPYPESPSFLRFQYPSALPEGVLQRAETISRAVVERLGLDATAFNIEFVVDREREGVTVLEVNPRHSQSHARLFEHVDGAPNHQCMVRLGLGLDPRFPHREGTYRHAAKWFVRRFTDSYVRRSPTEAEIRHVESRVPGCTAEVVAEEGAWLSECANRDSYSYEPATIHIGADSEEELSEKYETFLAELPLELDEPPPRD
ncbi:Carbamoyl-phosphate synthase L chain, ATP binding domain [Haloechinothrix alba]|uniref:Carbamoyl-phosphate synthase L chain, ATP binding domain n=1 Tax=Haloechinothrix alba TaxID=664784 RepID=A0A238XB67_9PSEU|nr:hypothetical protein [Haloechinothrix alba]SNR55783.1 Carbamoyl-phosphate synthase L chain, ATP binding domain [Haloechinothrix alba]